MTDITLVNEDGTIEGVDPESGESVPVGFDELRSSSHETSTLNGIECPDPTDGQAGLEALDDPGQTILLRPKSTYVIDDPPLRFEADDLTIVGSTSSVVTWADGVIPDDTVHQMEIAGANVTLAGWTFDGNIANQGTRDSYGIRFEGGAVDATISNMVNQNAVGDAYGALRRGASVTNCLITGFGEDGIESWATEDGISVSDCYIRGAKPFKAYPRPVGDVGHITFSNCTLVGTGNTAAVHFEVPRGEVVEDITFDACRLSSENRSAIQAWTNDSDATGLAKNVTFDGCTFHDVSEILSVNGPDGFGNMAFRGLSIVGGHAYGIADGGFDLRYVRGGSVRGLEFASSVANYDVQIRPETTDVDLGGRFPNGIDGRGDGTRVTVDGTGLNDGDPSSTGDWNGHGAEGVLVYDASESRPYPGYRYVDGAFQRVDAPR